MQDILDDLYNQPTFQQHTMKDPYRYTNDPSFDTHPNAAGHALWAGKLIERYKELTNT